MEKLKWIIQFNNKAFYKLLKKLRKMPFVGFEKGVVPEGQVINTNNTNYG